MIHFLCYMRDPKSNDPNSNHYALPLPIVPVLETGTMEVVRVDWAYTGNEEDGMKHTFDPETVTDHLTANEYDPKLSGVKERPIKPLHVEQ
jgi:primary-amine oxidase